MAISVEKQARTLSLKSRAVKALAILVLGVSFILSVESGAAIGFLIGGADAPKISLYAAAGTMATGFGVQWMLNQPECKKPEDPNMPLKVAGIISLIELEQTSNNALTFSTLDDITAQKMGLSPEQQQKWNEHINEVKTLQDEVTTYVSKSYSEDCVNLQLGKLKTTIKDQVGRTKKFIDDTMESQNWSEDLKSAYQKINAYGKKQLEEAHEAINGTVTPEEMPSTVPLNSATPTI